MMIRLVRLDESDVEAHNAGEDEHTVRWLSGAGSTDESTRRHFHLLAQNELRNSGKRGFGVWLDDRLAGYIDFELDSADVPARGDVNLAYSVHSWARRRGVATAAVNLVCDHLVDRRIGRRAVIRTETGNTASALVAERCGFIQIDSADAEGYRLWARILS